MPTMAEVRAKFPQYNDMSDQQLAGALHKKFYSDMPEAEFNAKIGMAAPQAPAAPDPRSFQGAEMAYLQQRQAAQQPAAPPPNPNGGHIGADPAYQGNTFGAATEASQAGLLGGYDDELKAAMNAPIDAIANVVRGGSFNPVEAYTARQKGYDQQKAARRAEHPIASLGGEIAGGLALGGSVRGAPTTARAPAPAAPTSISTRLAPFVGKTGASALEGAGYGAVYGSGEAKPGERLAGAGKGAAVGFGTGAALETLGGALANQAGKRQLAKAPPAPGEAELAADAHALYTKADQAGVMIKHPSFNRVAQNAKVAAGSVNPALRPKTAGILDEIDALQTSGQPITLRRLDELRQEVGLAMKRADPQDVRTLERVKNVIDNFADNAKPTDITGDIRGFQHIKEARKLWARKAKTEIVNKILDMADVRTGQYTQSGLANTIVKEMRTLYKSIQSGRTKGFTADEIALIRQMAKGGSNSQAVNLLAKFAPRGVVSTLGGFALGGPALTLAGHVGGVMADKGAMTAASKLRDATARGYVPQVPQLPNRLRPLIPAGVAGATEAGRLLFPNQ